MSPDLPPFVANVVEALAAAGDITNVVMLKNREAQDMFKQLGGQVSQFFGLVVRSNPI